MSRGQKETLGEKLQQGVLLLIFLLLLLPFGLLAIAAFVLSRVALNMLVWLLWIPKGKRALVVYSDSTIWKNYFENEIIPVIAPNALFLNWSHRKRWSRLSLKVRVFRSFSGERNHTPMVLVFHPLRTAEQFRFYEPFQDFKKGNAYLVEKMKRDLIDSLGLSATAPNPR